MRRATAIARLATIAGECQRVSRFGEDKEPVLAAAYAFGDLVDGAEDMEVVEVAFVLQMPAEELTWCAEPPGCLSLVHFLGLENAPVAWYWRPDGWPVANHVIRRPLLIWSAIAGTEHQALEGLTQRDVENLRLPPPTHEQERQHRSAELAASLAHLRATHAEYWARDWRREHRGGGIHPEQYLWNAVHGYLDLLEAQDAS